MLGFLRQHGFLNDCVFGQAPRLKRVEHGHDVVTQLKTTTGLRAKGDDCSSDITTRGRDFGHKWSCVSSHVSPVARINCGGMDPDKDIGTFDGRKGCRIVER